MLHIRAGPNKPTKGVSSTTTSVGFFISTLPFKLKKRHQRFLKKNAADR